MKSNTRAACMAIAMFAAAISYSAHAQTWRCGNTYTDEPCKDGKEIALDDPRGVAQRREADASTREAKAAASRMERERVQLERVQAGRGPAVIERPNSSSALSQATSAQGRKQRGDAPEYFNVRDPAAAAKKKVGKATRKKTPID